ncbi:Transcription factor [Penicillium griseofulvum]|uniref:Transcription factor n=1 Tax=Penicillium patulum TaxID=5078 RepID=A0A135LWW3_PENPA|nr:Transcription factor [Penicillium griseofulvum]KXG53457.1 Transcription factor [Penicillium griseofulvum]
MATPTSASEQTVTAKTQRTLACVLCQQRKIKCDRTFPCINCVRACVQCKQATRQRRRRFPEKELLERLRYYERLLRLNNIKFNPLHTSATDRESPVEDGGDDISQGTLSECTLPDKDSRRLRESTTGKRKPFNKKLVACHESKDPNEDENDSGFLHDNDDVRQAVIKKAWNNMFQGQSNDQLLFGSSVGKVNLSALHPTQVHIFRLWQIYLDNVNPLLRVTHTPTLQTRIIDAASDIANIDPKLEALMFSIYCVSISSITEDQCSASFGSSKKDLLAGNHECLTALYLYLVSIRPNMDPASLSSLLGVAIRIAQRIGIDNESMYGKYSALEAEVRRRLWWSLVIFDNRICEMSDYKTASLVPTWDCRLPLNINDFELQAEMKATPAESNRPTEMVFAVVRSELANFVRHSAFHLDCTNPFLSTICGRSTDIDEAEGLLMLEKTIEEKYLSFCNPENPLHFMTIWTTRGYLAKARLLERYSRYSSVSVPQADTQRSIGISHALRMLECDTNLMTSPLTKGYLWFIHFHFPFLAYIHLLQSLKNRPLEEHADQAWEVMSNNYEVRIMDTKHDDRPFFIILSRIVFQAWQAREQVAREEGRSLVPPRIVLDIREKVMQMTINFGQDVDTVQPGDTSSINEDNLPVSTGVDFNVSGSLGTWGYADMSGPSSMDVDPNQLLMNTMDWSTLHVVRDANL